MKKIITAVGAAAGLAGWSILSAQTALAAPVLRRLEALLRHPKRGFTERVEVRQSPRGRVDWSRWARNHVPSGQWTSLPCHFTEPDDDPDLMAAVKAYATVGEMSGVLVDVYGRYKEPLRF